MNQFIIDFLPVINPQYIPQHRHPVRNG